MTCDEGTISAVGAELSESTTHNVLPSSFCTRV